MQYYFLTVSPANSAVCQVGFLLSPTSQTELKFLLGKLRLVPLSNANMSAVRKDNILGTDHEVQKSGRRTPSHPLPDLSSSTQAPEQASDFKNEINIMPCKPEARDLQIFLSPEHPFSFFHIFTSFSLSISLSLSTTSFGTAAPKKQADVEMLRWEGLSDGTAWVKNLASDCTTDKGGSLRNTHPGCLAVATRSLDSSILRTDAASVSPTAQRGCQPAVEHM